MEYTDAALILSKSGTEKTAVVKSKLACDGVKILIKTGDVHFGIPCQKFEFSTVDKVPVSLDYAEHGAAFQWSSHDQEYRMVIETDETTLRQLLRSVCMANINGKETKIKQRISPIACDTDIQRKTISTTTSVALDATTGILAIDDSDCADISPQMATTVSAGSVNGRHAIQVAMIRPDETITTRIIFDSTRVCQLVRDYLVADYTLSGTGGPISLLLIDDEPLLTELAKDQLKKHHENMTIETASTFEHATQLLNNGSFDCVVSDYHIPEDTIHTLTSCLKQTNQSVPFIIFSRKAKEEVPPENRPDSVDEWIQKDKNIEIYCRLGVAIKRHIAQTRQSSNHEPEVRIDPTVLNNTTRKV
jgi:FOG: CheY-like receiver